VGAGLVGSGRGAIRAVSFFKLSEVPKGGLGGESGNFATAGMFTGAAGLAMGRSGAGAGGEGGGGGALGGNGVGAVETGGSEGVDGGRAGRLIRTVSRDSLLVPGGFAAGGKVMRTVSFLGSFESAMKIWRVGPKNCAKIRLLSLVNLILAATAA